MKAKRFLSVLMTLLILKVSAHACIELLDEQSFGILFNNNEVLSLKKFDTLGKEDTHYFRDCMMINADHSTKEVKVLSPAVEPVNWNDFFSIENVSITCNLLEIEVTYGGGCKTHEFMLYVDSVVIDSDPPILNFTLLHNANGDACKAIVTETLVFNIKPVEELYSGLLPLQIQINNKMMGIKWYRDNACTIKYRSHTSSDLMVYLEYSRMALDASQVFPSMRIILDPSVKYANGFDYGKALATELRWLTDNKILSGVTEKTFSRIEQTMKNMRGQFWTLQDSLVPYNGGLFYLNVNNFGELTWGDLVQIKRVSCDSTLEFTLPPEPLSGGSTSTLPSQVIPDRETFSVKVTGNTYLIDLGRNSVSSARIEITDLKGRLMSSFTIPAHQQSIALQTPVKLSCGMYQVVLKTKERILRKTLVITE